MPKDETKGFLYLNFEKIVWANSRMTAVSFSKIRHCKRVYVVLKEITISKDYDNVLFGTSLVLKYVRLSTGCGNFDILCGHALSISIFTEDVISF